MGGLLTVLPSWKYILREDFYLLRKSLFSTLISMSRCLKAVAELAWALREEICSLLLSSFLLAEASSREWVGAEAVLFQATYFTLMVVIRLSIRESLQHRLQPPFLNKVWSNILEIIGETFTSDCTGRDGIPGRPGTEVKYRCPGKRLFPGTSRCPVK